MAVCLYSTVYADACSNGFVVAASDAVLSRALELQLLYNRAGGSETAGELFDQAKSSGFCALASETIGNAVELQLLCNISGGT